MKKSLIALLAVNLYYSQNIGINTATPDLFAILELSSKETLYKHLIINPLKL